MGWKKSQNWAKGDNGLFRNKQGWKPIRVFDGRGQGRFKLTRVGKRFYHQNTLNEYVIQLPALFRTYKASGIVEHRGFYPIHALPANIRARLDLVFEGEMAAGRAAEINNIKTLIENTLQNRQTADGYRILSYEPDQEILLEPQRPWKISYLDTEVTRPDGVANPSRSVSYTHLTLPTKRIV